MKTLLSRHPLRSFVCEISPEKQEGLIQGRSTPYFGRGLGGSTSQSVLHSGSLGIRVAIDIGEGVGDDFMVISVWETLG